MFLNVRVANNVTRNTVVIDSAKTIREAFEQANVDMTGIVMLNGSTLMPTEIDDTFDDRNVDVSRPIFLSACQKLDNAVECKILAETAVITSLLKKSEFELLKQYRPDALTLCENGEESFKIDIGDIASISQYGAMFVPSADGTCRIQVALPADCGTKEFVAKTYGRALCKIKDIETDILERNVVEQIALDQAEIEDLITVL